MDLLISYSWGNYFPAYLEAVRLLKRFGDPQPAVEKTKVWGIAVAHTTLNNRVVIQKCRELYQAEPEFQFTLKWVPVDFWVDTDLDAIKKVIEEKIRDRIEEKETWAMKVEKRRWQRYHTIEIIEYLARSIESKVDLRRPDKIVRIDVLGSRTAISLLKPEEIFSIALPA
jgi:tRNA acetyltransferase TAN1